MFDTSGIEVVKMAKSSVKRFTPAMVVLGVILFADEDDCSVTLADSKMTI